MRIRALLSGALPEAERVCGPTVALVGMVRLTLKEPAALVVMLASTTGSDVNVTVTGDEAAYPVPLAVMDWPAVTVVALTVSAPEPYWAEPRREPPARSPHDDRRNARPPHSPPDPRFAPVDAPV